ncbi:MAG TPA: toll/interleukin-1 receptor domain-containing protein [Chthoniobacterales bacterium]|nr:toll/interleukin-1 receptor domain-containing protein [Chthoniobacterales bacterium]
MGDGATRPSRESLSEDERLTAKMQRRVFLSYAAADTGEAIALRDALEAYDIHCFFAPRDIGLGTKFAGAITDAIARSSALVYF